MIPAENDDIIYEQPLTGGLGNFGRLGSERRSQSLEMVEVETRRRRGEEAEVDQVVNVC